VRWLEVQATDDALELFDVFMTNELIGRAGKHADKQMLSRLPGQSRHVAVLAQAVQVLFEADGRGEAVAGSGFVVGGWGGVGDRAVGLCRVLYHVGAFWCFCEPGVRAGAV